MLRKAEGEADEIAPMAGEKLPKEWLEFAKELRITLPAGKAISFGQNLFWAPAEMPDIKRLKVMRPGLELGEVKKGRFEPAHHLALWLKDCANDLSFPAESAEIREYMHGNVLSGNQKGWCLIKADGYTLGWAKGDGRQLKNHYPKGLRR